MGAPRKTLGYGLTANVVILGVVSLLTDVSSEMILPILPFFLTEVLLANGLIVGFVEGLSESVVAFMKVVSGRWSDLAGKRKRFVGSGYALSAAMKLLFPFAPGWPHFLAMRAGERVGKGVRDAPRDALLTESAPADARGKAFGFHRSMDTTGAVLGPILTLLVLATLAAPLSLDAAYRLVFLLAAIPAALSVAVVLLVREPRGTPRPRRTLRVTFRGAPRGLLVFVGIASLFSFAEFSYAFLLLRVEDAGESTSVAILLYVLFNIVYAAHAFPAGILSDRIGRKPVILVGYVCFASMAALLAIAPSLPTLILGFAFYGLSLGMAEGTQRALVADLAPADMKATLLGAYHTSTGFVKLGSGLVAGFLWVATVDHSGTFWFGAIAASCAAVGLAAWKPPTTS
ncbi:MAG TPA: MFS transporter [Thermoplasmata archaeon]|nr:MFS transporter [Thermoplasmata archaeon]